MPLHKPIRCTLHKKKIEYYCITCQVRRPNANEHFDFSFFTIRDFFYTQETICEDCVHNEHSAPVHVFEDLGPHSLKARPELENVLQDTQQQLGECAKSNTELENALDELQNQHDNTKDLINETYQVNYEGWKFEIERIEDAIQWENHVSIHLHKLTIPIKKKK